MSNNLLRISKRLFSGSRNFLFRLLLLAWILIRMGLPEAHSQINNTVYFMNRLPQSSLLNPAMMPEYQVYLGLPVLSSFNMGVGNNFTSYNDVIFKSPVSDSLITFLHPKADKNAFIKNLRDANAVNSDMHLNVFSLGIRSGSRYFSFSISERLSMQGSIPKDLFIIMLKGNEEYIGKEADFSSFGFDFSFFREYALGYSQEINNKWVVGGRAKLLFGKANIFVDKQSLGLYTNPDDYRLKLHSRFTMNTSLPISVEYDEENQVSGIAFRFDDDDFKIRDWVFNTGNKGIAFDMGVSFKPIEALSLSAAIIDLGSVKWNKDVYNFSMDGELEFDGVDISPIFNEDNEIEVFENFFDSVADIFAITESRNAYTKSLNTKVFLGGEYQIKPKLRLGALSRTGFGNNRVEQALTLSANWDLTRFFSASASYSMMNNSYNNLGAGLCLRGGPFQFFMISDNINAIFAPHKMRSVNFWFGMNLVFGLEKKIEPQEPSE